MSVESESVREKAIRLKREMVEVKCDQEVATQCSICLEDVKSFAYHTRCGHTFHSRCIKKYRTISGSTEMSEMSVRGYSTHNPPASFSSLSLSPPSRRRTIIQLAERLVLEGENRSGDIPCPNCRTTLSQHPSTPPPRRATSRFNLRTGANTYMNYGHGRTVVRHQVRPAVVIDLEEIDLDFY